MEANIRACAIGECVSGMPGSESVAGKRTAYIGTWENRNVPYRSDQGAEEATRTYGDPVVGLTHSRGVGRVMPVESRYMWALEGVSSLTQSVRTVMPYTEMETTWQKLSLIAGHAQRDPDFQFTSLAPLLNVKYLRDCYHSLNRNRAVGIDNVKLPKPKIVCSFYVSPVK